MQVTYDPAKRATTLRERGLDFEDARSVFAGPTYKFQDVREDYGEERMMCVGLLEG
ncbi:MAG: BrnT family toxin [Nevskiaceae bacterium]